MPPPVEDNSDGEGDIPFTDAKSEQVDSPYPKDEDDDDEEDGEDVYVVERIKDHQFQTKGKSSQLFLLVKWKGYEDPQDMTWEPENGLDGAQEIVDDYYQKIGGRPEPPAPKTGPGRKRKSIGDTKSTPSAATESIPNKKKRKSTTNTTKFETPVSEPPAETEESDEDDNWLPKGDHWDDKVKMVDTIIRDPNNSELYALLIFTNGKKSKVLVETCYQRCPYKICKFYESHLVFK